MYTDEKDNFETGLFILSKNIGKLSDLREIAVTGLNMPNSSVEKHVNNFPNDITSAAFALLMEWFLKHRDIETARENIKKALKATQKDLLIQIFNSKLQMS